MSKTKQLPIEIPREELVQLHNIPRHPGIPPTSLGFVPQPNLQKGERKKEWRNEYTDAETRGRGELSSHPKFRSPDLKPKT